MARRGENIRKRKDGRWEGRYMRKSGDGTKKVHSVYARTYAEVKKKLAEAKEELIKSENCGNAVPRKAHSITASAEEWLNVIQKERKYSTYVKYRNLYHKHIKVCLEQCGNQTRVTEVTDKELFEGKTLADSTKRAVITVFKAILKYAGERYQIHNITLALSSPPVNKKGIEVFNVCEQAKLLHFAYEDMDIHKMGIVLGLSTGLRLGELCALKWSDINLEMKLLHVNSTVQRIAVEGEEAKTCLMETEPKSSYSMREIPLSDDIVSLLLKYRNNQIYVIGGEKPVEPRTYQNKFKSYLKQSDVAARNFHVLRHTFATNCISSGIDAKSLSEILGHSDVKITLNKYVHPSLEIKRQHMNSLSSIYGQYMSQPL